MGKKVGKLIKAARTGADMTQEQFARRISSLSASDISQAERGEKDLTQAQLKKIATITGVTQASLINAAKEESGSATKQATAKKSTAAKTPANANSTMKVTSTERKLVEAYRMADADTKKRAMNLLKGKEEGVLESILGSGDIADTVENVLGDVLGGLLGNK